MSKAAIPYDPIGVIHSEHIAAVQTPIYAKGRKGRAEIFPEFTARPPNGTT